MYEHNDYTYIEVLLTSQSMADMLNKFEYINKISEYDRQMLEEYQSTINMISSSKVKLEEDRENLTANQESLQAQLDALEVVQNEKTSRLNALKRTPRIRKHIRNSLRLMRRSLNLKLLLLQPRLRQKRRVELLLQTI